MDNITCTQAYHARMMIMVMYTDPDLVYNTDETGLLYRLLPDRTLASKRKEAAAKGFKSCKDRLTALVTSNSTGTDKHRLLIIGKSARPLCFRKVRANTIPVLWKSNNTAWMNTNIFLAWIKGTFVPDVKAFKRRTGKALDAKVRMMLGIAVSVTSKVMNWIHSYVAHEGVVSFPRPHRPCSLWTTSQATGA